jgi:NADH dehydrogenase
MSEKSSAEALEYMGHLMVNVKLGKTMKTYADNVITFADGEQMYTEMVIWTAGITGEPFTFVGDQPLMSPGNRFTVDAYNCVQGLKDVYAIGDICCHTDERYPRGCPQLAQVAIQQGVRLAKNLNRPDKRQPFDYVDKGSMATVGRNRAVVDLKHSHLYGRPAWITWMFVHLISLLGMRNKITVLINWIWSYCTYSSSVRLLLRPNRYPLREGWSHEDKKSGN